MALPESFTVSAPYFGQEIGMGYSQKTDPLIYEEFSPKLMRNYPYLGSIKEGISSPLLFRQHDTPTAQLEEDFNSDQYLKNVDSTFDIGGMNLDLVPAESTTPLNAPEVKPPGAVTQSEAPLPTEYQDHPIYVSLRHKPRGSKGLWQPIEVGERIRVDKRKGKIVQLVVKTTLPLIEHNMESQGVSLKVSLLDLRSPYYVFEEELMPTITGPSIHPPETPEEKKLFGTDARIREIQLKVRMGSISKKQVYQVTVLQNGNPIAIGKSTEFCSDDNGKLYTPVGRKRRRGRAPPKEDNEEEEEEEEHTEQTEEKSQEEEENAKIAQLKKEEMFARNNGSPMMTRSRAALSDTFSGGASQSMDAIFGGYSNPIAPLDYMAKDSENVTAKRLKTSLANPRD